MELLNKSGVALKSSGDGLSHQDVNAINSTANLAVGAINDAVLMNFCNINSEVNDYTRSFTLSTAVKVVPKSRRRPGLKIRYLNSEGIYSEYIYTGKNSVISDEEWEREFNWSISFTSIDGGEW